jgi:hypothetical protein
MAFRNSLHLDLIMPLRQFLRRHRFDVMHTHFSRDLRFIVPASEGIRPKMTVVLSKRVGSYIRKKNRLHRYLYSHVNLVLAIT